MKVLNVGRKLFYSGAAAAALACMTSCATLRNAEKNDKFEKQQTKVELCEEDNISTAKAFLLELVAACAVVGIGILGAWEPKNPNKSN